MSLTPYYNQYHTQDSTNYQSYAVGYYNQSVASQRQSQQGPPVIIAVFGKTGTGKTTFVRNVTNADYEVGHGLTSRMNQDHILTIMG
jgi:polynucleotide 5'-kinase involved in rRNA processing